MLKIKNKLLREIAAQSTSAVGRVLGGMVVDYTKAYRGGMEDAVREGWLGTDIRDVPEAISIFAHLGKAVEEGRGVTHYESADQEFSILVGFGPDIEPAYPNRRLRKESKIRAILLGKKFALHTDDLIEGSWETIKGKPFREFLEAMEASRAPVI